MRIEDAGRWEGLFSTQKHILRFKKWSEVDKPNYSTFVTCLTELTQLYSHWQQNTCPVQEPAPSMSTAIASYVGYRVMCSLLSPSSSGAVQMLLIHAAVLLTSHGSALSTKWLSPLLLSSGYFIILTKSSNFNWREEEAPRSEYHNYRSGSSLLGCSIPQSTPTTLGCG